MRRFALLLCLASVSVAAGEPIMEPEPEWISIALPKGDAQAGRQAFILLSCVSCHRVEGDNDLPAPLSAHPGPTFGRIHSLQDPAQLAGSIVAPSHQITEDVRVEREDGLSEMGDFTEAMTVRQLIDLIAYVGSRGRTQESPDQ